MSEEANPSQQTKARPLRYWQQFNSWWRSELERKGVRPSGNDIGRQAGDTVDLLTREFQLPAASNAAW